MIKKLFAAILARLEQYAVTGLVVLIPMSMTIALFLFIFRLFYRWIAPIHAYLPHWMQEIPYGEVLGFVLLVLLIGAVINIFVLHWVIRTAELVIDQIPLLHSVYSGVKQLVTAFTQRKKTIFHEVMLIRFPHSEVYSVCFLMEPVDPRFAPHQSADYVNVFVPSVPNPTTGFYLMVNKKDLLPTDLSHKDALGLVMSGGIIKPEGKK